jgi:hypothetical protein
VNGKGLVTGVTPTPIQISQSQVDGLEAELDDLGDDLNTKASFAQLATKADLTALDAKADVSALAGKADVSALDAKASVTDLAAKVDKARAINTSAPLTGGGDLTVDRTLSIPPASPSAGGYMTAADKTKLDSLSTGPDGVLSVGPGNPTLVAGGTASDPTLKRAAITGDVSIPDGSNVAALATVNPDTGLFGGAASVPRLSVNGKGLVTGVTPTPIQIGQAQVDNLVTDLAAKAAIADLAGKVGTARAINTTAPLTGGGDLTADRTLGIAAASASAPGSMSAADKAKLDGMRSNQAAGSQSFPASATTLMAGTVLPCTPRVGARFRFQFQLNKTTAAGAATWSALVKFGTAGTTADGTICAWTSGTNTAIIDTVNVTLYVEILTLGAAATCRGLAMTQNWKGTATTGLSVLPAAGTPSAFNSALTPAFISLSITHGASIVSTGWGAVEALAA